MYLSAQIGFLIGGEQVASRESKYTNFLGWTKFAEPLGKQQLELSTLTG